MIEIKIDNRKAIGLLNRLSARAADATPAMREVSAIMLDAVEENFKEEGRPKWPPLSTATIKGRKRTGHWPGPILQRKGRLAASITQKYDGRSAVVGTNARYAAIHQFGGEAGRKGRRVSIPARPFLALREEDLGEIRTTLERYLAGEL